MDKVTFNMVYKGSDDRKLKWNIDYGQINIMQLIGIKTISFVHPVKTEDLLSTENLRMHI